MEEFKYLSIDVKGPGLYDCIWSEKIVNQKGESGFCKRVVCGLDKNGDILRWETVKEYSEEKLNHIKQEVKKRLMSEDFKTVLDVINTLVTNEEQISFSVENIDEYLIVFTIDGIEGVKGFVTSITGALSIVCKDDRIIVRNLEKFCPKFEKELFNHPKFRLKRLLLS